MATDQQVYVCMMPDARKHGYKSLLVPHSLPSAQNMMYREVLLFLAK